MSSVNEGYQNGQKERRRGKEKQGERGRGPKRRWREDQSRVQECRETKGREAATFLTFKLLLHLIFRKQSRVSTTSPTLHTGRLRLCRLSNMSDAAS